MPIPSFLIFRKIAAGAAALTLVGTLGAGAAEAQFPDEVWVQPRSYADNGTTCAPTDPCCFLRRNDYYSDMLDDVTTPANWPTTLPRTNVLSLLVGTFAAPCQYDHDDDPNTADLELSWLNDDDLKTLDTFLGDQNIEMAITVGGANFSAADLCNPSATPGEDTAGRDDHLFKRWLDEGGSVDHIFFDFPFKKVLTNSAYNVNCPAGTPHAGNPPSSYWTLDKIAEQLRKYLDELDNLTGYSTNPKIHLWDGGIGYELSATDDDPEPWGAGISFSELLDAMVDAMDDGGYDFVSYLTDADPQYVQNQDEDNDGLAEWNFTRVLWAEDVARSKGLKVGVTNLLGPCAFGALPDDSAFFKPCNMDISEFSGNGPKTNWSDDQFNAWARKTFIRYTAEYEAAGGDPDSLMLAVWHRFPDAFGSEGDASIVDQATVMADVVNDVYPEALYVEEDFEGPASYTQYPPSGSDPTKWDAPSGTWESFSNAALYQNACSGQANSCTAATQGFTQLNFENEQFRSLETEVVIKLEEGDGWAGVHLKKQNAAHLPTSGSGYLIHLSDHNPSDPVLRVTLYSKSHSGSSTLNKWFVASEDITAGLPEFSPTAWTRLKIRLEEDAEVNGEDRIRVTVCQGAVCREAFDELDDRWPSGGELGLMTNDQSAKFDNFSIRRLLPYAKWCDKIGGCTDEFERIPDGGTGTVAPSLADWNLTGTWNAPSGMLEGESLYAVWDAPTGETRTRYHASVDMTVPATGYAGLQFGQTANNVGVSHSGLLLKLYRQSGSAKLDLLQWDGTTVSVVDGGNASATLNVDVSGTDPVTRISARVEDHRVRVYENGELIPELSNYWFDGGDSNFITLQPGFVGLTGVLPPGSSESRKYDNFWLFDYEPVPAP